MGKAAGTEKGINLESLLTGEVNEDRIAKLSFEEALKLLEEVVTSVESGDLPLDRAIGSYEKGSTLIQHLRKLLSGAEEKIRMLSSAE